MPFSCTARTRSVSSRSLNRFCVHLPYAEARWSKSARANRVSRYAESASAGNGGEEAPRSLSLMLWCEQLSPFPARAITRLPLASLPGRQARGRGFEPPTCRLGTCCHIRTRPPAHGRKGRAAKEQRGDSFTPQNEARASALDPEPRHRRCSAWQRSHPIRLFQLHGLHRTRPRGAPTPTSCSEMPPREGDTNPFGRGGE